MINGLPETPAPRPRPVIVIVAGGRATRMGGGDKALVPFGAATLLDHIISRVSLQRALVVLNANGDPERLSRFGLPIVADTVRAIQAHWPACWLEWNGRTLRWMC